MRSIAFGPFNSYLVSNVLRWTALTLFLSSLVLPNGLGAEYTGIGWGAWLVSLWPGILFGPFIPLAGISNVFFLTYVIRWNHHYKWSVMILCLGIAVQALIIVQLLHDNSSGRYVGIGYILWMASLLAAVFGMLLRNRASQLEMLDNSHMDLEKGIAAFERH